MLNNNQINTNQLSNSDSDKSKAFLQPKKIIVLIVLTGILIYELIWAISWITSTKKTAPSTTVQTVKEPKEQIASLKLFPENIQTKVGNQFNIKVYVDTNNRQVNGIDAIIVYDPKVLEVIGKPTVGDLFTSLLVNEVDATQGQIILTGTRLSKQSQPIAGTGTLANISFVSKTSGNTSISFLFDPEKTNTSNVIESVTSNNILTDTNSATIQISD